MTEGREYRNVGGTHRRTDGTFIQFGEVFVPTPRELEKFPDKFEPVAEVAPDLQEQKAAALIISATKAEDPPEGEDFGDPVAEAPDIEQFHTGRGWYEIPGVGKVRGKQKALAALLAGTP